MSLRKYIAYYEKRRIIQKCKVQSTAKFEEIDIELCERLYRTRVYIEYGGGHFEHCM